MTTKSKEEEEMRLLNALQDALKAESILPSRPPPARLATSRSRLIPNLRYISPSTSLPTASPSPVTLTLSTSRSFTAPTASSSIDTLRSIHSSAVPPPSPRAWWFRSDHEPRESVPVTSAPSEPDLLPGDLGKKFRAPNAPLVFCHGLLGFDSVTIGPAIAPLQVSHWRGIKEALEANGCEVLITRVPATSSPVDRAKVLEKKISETYPGREVHLIGHSMGGIDSRYLITHLTQRTFHVLSLTTIATPHRGSSFASHFLSLASDHLPAVLALLECLPNGGGDGKAFQCLTREAMQEFNDNTPDVDGVRYFSWGAEYEPGLIDPWKYPHSIIAAEEGANDGLVSVQSAQWGTYLGTLRNVNHLDLVGWTGGLAGNLSSLAGFKDMHAFIRGKDVGFSPERFYESVADLLAGVEEEEGYVVDGKWVGRKGKEERKKAMMRMLTDAEDALPDKAVNTETDIAADKERRRMEEILQSTLPSPLPSRSGSSISYCKSKAEVPSVVQVQHVPPVAEREPSQQKSVPSRRDTSKTVDSECIISDGTTPTEAERKTDSRQGPEDLNSPKSRRETSSLPRL